MLEIIIFIIIIVAISSKNKKKPTSRGNRPQTPPITKKVQNPQFPKKTVRKQTAASKSVRPESTRPSAGSSASSAQTAYEQARPARNHKQPRIAGERHEEWFPIPENKKVVRCHYCAACNQIPLQADPSQYSCYFCREDL